MSGIPYLTQEWLDMSTSVMEPMPPCPGATFVMQCVMTEAPGGGDVVFHRVFDEGRLVCSVLADHGAPDVVLYSTYGDSILHLTGGLPEKEAFRSGRIRPEGDVQVLKTLTPLSRSADYLAAVDEIARRTDFSAPSQPA
ncbi:MAG: SCP2 sterol-binding domain-containing protein [Pseudonocardia sp.]|nr:SCP2 sterol-binding domain-containing protein [Pseudonocardia sp.]